MIRCRSDMLQRCIVIMLRHLVKDGRMVHFLFASIAPVFPLAVILCCLLLEFVKPGFGIMAGLQAHYAKEFWYMWKPSECKTTRTCYSQWQKSQIPAGRQALEVLWSDTNWLGSDSALHRRSLQHVQSFKLPGSWWRRRNLADEWDRVGCWTFEPCLFPANRP